jgi:hypothetical protein
MTRHGEKQPWLKASPKGGLSFVKSAAFMLEVLPQMLGVGSSQKGNLRSFRGCTH